MTTLVLDDLCAPQRDLLSAMPVLERCEWRLPGGVGFPAYFAALGTSRSAGQGNGLRQRQDSPGREASEQTVTGAGA